MNQLKMMRSELGLTQSELAMLIGVNPYTVSKYERGVLDPNPFQAALLHEFHAASRVGCDGAAAALANGGVPAALRLLLGEAAVLGRCRQLVAYYENQRDRLRERQDALSTRVALTGIARLEARIDTLLIILGERVPNVNDPT